MPTRPSSDTFALAPAEPFQPAPERPDPSLGQVAAAAFRSDNDVWNVADWLTRPTFEPEPGYDVFQDPAFKGTLYQQQFDRNFWNSRSEAETQAIRARIDREREDDRTIDAAGWTGTVMGIGAGLISPTTFLPGGALVRGARGLSALRSALSVGTAAAGAVALQEAALQGAQETRTLAESGVNIASGAILGGLLGGGAAALVGLAERRALERTLDGARAPFSDPAAPVPNPAAGLVREDVLRQLTAAGVPEDKAAASADILAARYDTRARRLGLDPAEAFDLYQKEGIDIRSAEAPEVLGPDSLPQSWLDRLKAAGVSTEVKAPAPAAAARGESRGPVRMDTGAKEWTLYHGTEATTDFERFDPENGTNPHTPPDERGLFLAPSPGMAATYASGTGAAEGAGPRIFKVKVDPGRFKVLDLPEMIRSDPEFIDLLHAANSDRQGRGAEGSWIPVTQLDAHSRQRLADQIAQADMQTEAARAARDVIPDATDADISAMVERSRRVMRSSGALSAAVRYGQQHGYDTIVVRGLMEHDGADQVVVLRPDRVFSAYSGEKLYQAKDGAPRGAITLADNRAVIELFQGRDASTFMHESGHLWLSELVRDAEVSPAVKADLDVALRWLGVDDASKIGRAEQEKWAQGFEQYLRDGKAPSTGLARVFEQFKEWLTAIYRAVSDLGEPIPDDIRGVMDRMLAVEPPPREVGAPAAAGAAVADTRALTLERFGLDRVPGVMKMSPTLRALSSPFPAVRRAAADLAETALQFVENRAGIATTQGPALDRLARMQVAQARVAVSDELDRLFSQMRFNRSVTAPNARAFLEDVTGRAAPGAMTREDFNMEIGRAMRRGDQHEVPEVAQAAQFLRAKVFTPWKERAIKAGLLPEDVGVETAESYFQRVYDKGQIAGRRDEFVRRVTGWLGADQERKAAAQQRLAGLWEDKQAAEKAIRRMEAQARRLDARMQKLDAALSERAMEVGRTERRAGVLEERQALVAQEISDLEEFVGAMKGEIADPVLRDRILNLEGELKDLRRADRPVTEAQVQAAEQRELRAILTGETRIAAQMLVGQRKPYKAPSFLDYIVRGGGIADDGGEVMQALGGARSTKPGLVSSGGRSADDWGERLVEASGGTLTERPTPNEVLDWIDAAVRGEDPWWWRETRVDEAKARASQMATVWEEALNRAGAAMPQTIADVAKMLRGEQQAAGGGAVSLADLDRILGEMEAAGATVPAAGRADQVEGMLAGERAAIQKLRDLIGRAQADAGRLEARAGKDAIRAGEADIGVNANRGRLGILNDRMDRLDRLQGLVETFQRDAEARVNLARKRIEDELGAWEGKSTAEAMSALRQRAKAEAGRAPGAPRLGGADAAVDSAVRKILASERGLSEQELAAKASEITNRILGSPDGRLPYDAPSGGPRIGAGGEGPPPRGPLAARDFMIPDETIEDFLVSDAEDVAATHLRTIVPDVLLTERYGDVDMTYVFKAIDEDANAAALAAPNDKARREIETQRKGAIRDIAAMRDRIRSTYGISSDSVMQAAGRIGNAVKSFNVLTSMGGTVLSSVSDIAGPVFRHGFMTVMRDGWTPFFQSLADRSEGSPWRQAAGQYRAMGIATEMVLAGRMHGMAEITDLYRPHTRVERGLRWGADKLQVVNLQAPWTDWGKTTAAIVSGNEILRAAKAVSEGKAKPRQVTNLAASGIDAQMAAKIWGEFEVGGQVVDGVHLPNTADWADQSARAAFEGAVAREADIAIVTPGQEKPLWLSNPLLSVIGQFKTFVASSTERTLIANLQRRDAEALQGAITAVALGMVGYKLYSIASGRETSDRPQDWVKEGISRSGILGWLEEGNALAAKTTRGSVDLYRAIGADKPLSRFASRSVLDQLIGPTAGKIDALSRVTGSAASGEWAASDTHKVRTLMAMQNLFYLRGLFDAAEAGVNGLFGVPEQQPRR